VPLSTGPVPPPWSTPETRPVRAAPPTPTPWTWRAPGPWARAPAAAS